MPDSDFIFSTLDLLSGPQTLSAVESLFVRNGSSKGREHLIWQYMSPPAGHATVVIGADAASGLNAGMYAAFPVKMKVGAKSVAVVQSLDTLTDRDFRGRGLFNALASDCYRRCSSSDVSAVYGFPNGASVGGFFGKLGWSSLDPVPFMVRPIGFRYLWAKARLRQRKPSPSAWPSRPPGLRKIERCPHDVDKLWEAMARRVEVGVVRDSDYLTWRLFEKPNADYEVFETRTRDGKLVGLMATTVADKHGGAVGYVLDLMVDPEHLADGRQMLRWGIDNFASKGADIILAWNFAHSYTHGLFTRSGFVSLPPRFRPIELHVGVRCTMNDTAAVAGIRKRDNWYISYLDSDTV